MGYTFKLNGYRMHGHIMDTLSASFTSIDEAKTWIKTYGLAYGYIYDTTDDNGNYIEYIDNEFTDEYKVVVTTEVNEKTRLYSSNQIRFTSVIAARRYAGNLASKWLAVTDYQVLEATVKPDNGTHYSAKLVADNAINAIAKLR